MSKKDKRKYNSNQVNCLARKFGFPGNTSHKTVASKLAEYLSIENVGYRIVLSNYFENPTPITGFVKYVKKRNSVVKVGSFMKRMSGAVTVTKYKDGKQVIDVNDDDFLKSYQWRKLRLVALELHGRKCLRCGASPATGAVMHVDHIKPRGLYPALALYINNLQVLCEECNHGKG